MLRASGAALIGQVAQAGAAVLLALAVTFAFSPDQRGRFVLYASIAVLGTYLLGFGLVGALLHLASGNRAVIAELTGLACIGGVVVGAAAAAVGSVLVMPLVGLPPPAAGVLVLGCVSLALVVHLSWLAYGLGRFAFGGFLRAAPLAATAAVAASPGWLSSTSSTLFLVWAGMHALAAAAGLGVLGQLGVSLPSSGLLDRAMRYSIAYFGTQVGHLLALRVDQWILAALVSAAAVGTYSLAASISELALLAISAIGIVVFSESSSGTLGQQEFRRVAIWSLGLAAGCAAAMAALAPFIVGLLPDEYSPVTRLVQMLCLGVPGLVVLRLWTNRLSGLGHPWRASGAWGVALVFTVTLDFVLIARYEAAGAAAASVVGYTAGAVTGVALARSATASVASAQVRNA